MQRKRFVIVGIILLAGIIILSVINLGDNLVYFYTPEEVFAKYESLKLKTIRVGALVKTGSIVKAQDKIETKFLGVDNKGNEIEVTYNATPPDLFKEGQGVVIEGKLLDVPNKMKAEKLMVKHSEEYKKPDDHSTMNKTLLEKSIFKE